MHVALASDGRVVTGGEDGRVFCVQLDGHERQPLVHHQGKVSHLVLIDDARCVVTAGSDGAVYRTQLEGGRPVPLMRHEGPVEQLRLTTDARVVSSGGDATLLVTDLSGQRQSAFRGDLGFTHIEYDAGIRMLLAADYGGRVHRMRIID